MEQYDVVTIPVEVAFRHRKAAKSYIKPLMLGRLGQPFFLIHSLNLFSPE
jgi:hypothetical protein